MIGSPFLNPSHSTLRRKQGYSLIELLMVISIMGIVLGYSVSSFAAIQRSNQLATAYLNLIKMLERGRTEAMALHTHVWVGFVQSTTPGVANLELAGFASKDGTSDSSTSNLRQIWQVRSFPGLKLGAATDIANFSTQYGDLVSSTPHLPDVFSGSLQAKISGVATSFTDRVIEFSPTGEVVNVSQGWVGLPLMAVVGASQSVQANQSGCLLISKASGAVLFVRP